MSTLSQSCKGLMHFCQNAVACLSSLRFLLETPNYLDFEGTWFGLISIVFIYGSPGLKYMYIKEPSFMLKCTFEVDKVLDMQKKKRFKRF